MGGCATAAPMKRGLLVQHWSCLLQPLKTNKQQTNPEKYSVWKHFYLQLFGAYFALGLVGK